MKPYSILAFIKDKNEITGAVLGSEQTREARLFGLDDLKREVANHTVRHLEMDGDSFKVHITEEEMAEYRKVKLYNDVANALSGMSFRDYVNNKCILKHEHVIIANNNPRYVAGCFIEAVKENSGLFELIISFYGNCGTIQNIYSEAARLNPMYNNRPQIEELNYNIFTTVMIPFFENGEHSIIGLTEERKGSRRDNSTLKRKPDFDFDILKGQVNMLINTNKFKSKMDQLKNTKKGIKGAIFNAIVNKAMPTDKELQYIVNYLYTYTTHRMQELK